MGLLDFFTKTIGVDPGSQTLRIIHKGQLIFNETAELSIDPRSNKVSGYGNNAIHSEPHKVIKPVNTVIGDFHGFEHLLRGALRQALNQKSRIHSAYKIYCCLPMCVTEVEKRAYRDAAEHAGAKEVYMTYQPCSSAIGMGILFEKKDFVLVDFSASKVEITIFANSVPIAEGAIRIGTWKLQHALRNHLFRKYNLNLSSDAVEQLLFNLPRLEHEHSIEYKSVNTNELREVLSPYFRIIEDQLLETLEQAGRHERINQILSNGFYFTGGGAYVSWLVEKLALNRKLNVTISPTPLLDNINGLRQIIQSPEKFKGYLFV